LKEEEKSKEEKKSKEEEELKEEEEELNKDKSNAKVVKNKIKSTMTIISL